MVIKVGLDITVTSAPCSRGRPPPTRVWRPRSDIRGNLAPFEPPHLDACRVPQVREHTSTHSIEPRAEGGGGRVREAAAGVRTVAREACCPKNVGRVRLGGSGRARKRAGRAGAGVEGHLVVGLVIHPLDDVDLPSGGPVGAGGPPGGPRPAPLGHVREVGDKEAGGI